MFPALFTAEEFFSTSGSKKLQRINATVQTCIENHEVTKNCVLILWFVLVCAMVLSAYILIEAMLWLSVTTSFTNFC